MTIEDRYKRTREALEMVGTEADCAVSKHPAIHSSHEGYSVILEELDELWDEVKKQTKDRSRDRMRLEAMQVAAMAVRFMTDICWDD